jgi:hypothetical protein
MERFFLTAPELIRLAEEAQKMAGSSLPAQKKHHDLSAAVWTRQEENNIIIHRLKNVIQRLINPMTYDGEDLVNIVTKVVVPSEVKNDICSQAEIGQKKYNEFVEERINKTEVSVWARMKKVQLKMWKSTRKAVKHNTANKIVELKDDRALFARMLIVARSRSEINLKEAIGQHEFTAFPRALFAMDGSLLPCTDKSKLMNILEGLPSQVPVVDTQQTDQGTTEEVSTKKVIVVDGMAVVQAMGKPTWVQTCGQWAEHFLATLENQTKDYDEIHLVFDRYDVSNSLKEATRKRRQGCKPATVFLVEDCTPVGKLSVKQFLSSTTTKDALTVYLANKALHHYSARSKVFVATSRQDAFSNSIDVQHLCSNQEEADTKIILHGIDATRRGATELHIQSPDTDVFILAIHYYHKLCMNTIFITGSGNKRRQIPLAPVVDSLDISKTAALPGFHAFTGADQTGRFAGKGKLTCWQALNRCSPEVVSAFAALGSADELTTDIENAIEAFVCQLYESGTTMDTVCDLRWRLFTKKQLEAQKLPPTRGALHEAIARAHYQAMIWCQSDVPNPLLPAATRFGWKVDENEIVPITTKDPPAPESITCLIKCGCQKTKCTSHCSYRAQNMNCSEMCMCGADDDMCCNQSKECPTGIDSDEEDNDPSV